VGRARVGAALREAWDAGVVMSGVSAGAICWFAAGLTNSRGPGFVPIGGLGIAPRGFCPHADSDPARAVGSGRAELQSLGSPTMPSSGIAVGP
jgi:peptidase E